MEASKHTPKAAAELLKVIDQKVSKVNDVQAFFAWAKEKEIELNAYLEQAKALEKNESKITTADKIRENMFLYAGELFENTDKKLKQRPVNLKQRQALIKDILEISDKDLPLSISENQLKQFIDVKLLFKQINSFKTPEDFIKEFKNLIKNYKTEPLKKIVKNIEKTLEEGLSTFKKGFPKTLIKKAKDKKQEKIEKSIKSRINEKLKKKYSDLSNKVEEAIKNYKEFYTKCAQAEEKMERLAKNNFIDLRNVDKARYQELRNKKSLRWDEEDELKFYEAYEEFLKAKNNLDQYIGQIKNYMNLIQIVGKEPSEPEEKRMEYFMNNYLPEFIKLTVPKKTTSEIEKEVNEILSEVKEELTGKKSFSEQDIQKQERKKEVPKAQQEQSTTQPSTQAFNPNATLSQNVPKEKEKEKEKTSNQQLLTTKVIEGLHKTLENKALREKLNKISAEFKEQPTLPNLVKVKVTPEKQSPTQPSNQAFDPDTTLSPEEFENLIEETPITKQTQNPTLEEMETNTKPNEVDYLLRAAQSFLDTEEKVSKKPVNDFEKVEKTEILEEQQKQEPPKVSNEDKTVISENTAVNQLETTTTKPTTAPQSSDISLVEVQQERSTTQPSKQAFDPSTTLSSEEFGNLINKIPTTKRTQVSRGDDLKEERILGFIPSAPEKSEREFGEAEETKIVELPKSTTKREYNLSTSTILSTTKLIKETQETEQSKNQEKASVKMREPQKIESPKVSLGDKILASLNRAVKQFKSTTEPTTAPQSLATSPPVKAQQKIKSPKVKKGITFGNVVELKKIPEEAKSFEQLKNQPFRSKLIKGVEYEIILNNDFKNFRESEKKFLDYFKTNFPQSKGIEDEIGDIISKQKKKETLTEKEKTLLNLHELHLKATNAINNNNLETVENLNTIFNQIKDPKLYDAIGKLLYEFADVKLNYGEEPNKQEQPTQEQIKNYQIEFSKRVVPAFNECMNLIYKQSIKGNFAKVRNELINLISPDIEKFFPTYGTILKNDIKNLRESEKALLDHFKTINSKPLNLENDLIQEVKKLKEIKKKRPNELTEEQKTLLNLHDTYTHSYHVRENNKLEMIERLNKIFNKETNLESRELVKKEIENFLDKFVDLEKNYYIHNDLTKYQTEYSQRVIPAFEKCLSYISKQFPERTAEIRNALINFISPDIGKFSHKVDPKTQVPHTSNQFKTFGVFSTNKQTSEIELKEELKEEKESKEEIKEEKGEQTKKSVP